VIVYGPNIEEVARHPLVPRTVTGHRSEQPAHRPRPDVRHKHAILKERFAELGEVGTRFLDGLVRQHRCGKDQAHKVLALLGTYRRDDLVMALERALRYRAFSLKAVERILAVRAQPRPPLESLGDQARQHLQQLLDNDPVTPRKTAEYQELFGKETPADEEPFDAQEDQSPEAS